MTLLDEATRRATELALAQSMVNDHTGWFRANASDLLVEVGAPEVDLAGMWIGRRQGFSEATDPECVLLALEQCLEEHGMPLREAFQEPRGATVALDKVDKNLRCNKDWRQYYMHALDYHGGEEGVTITRFGGVNCTPIKKRPSGEKYLILEPGQEPMGSADDEG